MTEALLWTAVGLIAYTLGGFPLLVFLRGLVLPRPYRTEDVTPSLTVLVAAHNEAASLGSKIDNLLALDYPSDRLEIVIASDGSDDGTNEIVAEAVRGTPERVKLLPLPRVGKAAALEAGAAAASGEILVLSDANSMYAPDAVRRLVRPLADPAVGGAAGDQRYLTDPSAEGVAAGERGYWSFDRLLKRAATRAGSVVSATGAIYALRRSLFPAHIPSDVTDDFFISTGVVSQGKRLVFVPDAVAYEPVAPSAGIEFGRKVRVMTRGLRGVVARRELLNPFRHGFYAIQLFSHKVLRRLLAVPLALLLVTSFLLWQDGPAFRAVAIAQAALYGAGVLGILLGRRGLGRSRLLALPAFLCLANAASLVAVLNVLRGRRIERWEPERRGGHRSDGAIAQPGEPKGDSV
jgi:cellulose synthase/poly-beta-1,6-N-acetylglucosamine synthase-like glycosyltransferase